PKAPHSSAAPSWRSPPTRTSRAGTGSRPPADSLRRSTASPASTAAGPTPDAISSRCKRRGSLRTSPAIAEELRNPSADVVAGRVEDLARQKFPRAPCAVERGALATVLPCEIADQIEIVDASVGAEGPVRAG